MAFSITSVSYEPDRSAAHVTLADDKLGDLASTVDLSFAIAPAAVARSSGTLPEETVRQEAKVLLQKALDAL